MGIQRFIKAMKNRKDHVWVDIKELTPLKFMPYVAELFRNITGRDLKGLGDYTGWVGIGGYYHWKLSELGQLSACTCLQGQPVPDGPITRPSGRPHPRRPTQTGASATGASGQHQGRNQPTSDRAGNPATSNRGGKSASVGRGRKRATSGGSVDLPLEREGAGDGRLWYERSIQETGREAGKCRSPPNRLVPCHPGGRLSARSTNMWPVKTHLPATSPQRLFEPITPESRLEH